MRNSDSAETFVHIAIHRPRAGKSGDLTESMHRMRDAILAQPGAIDCYTLRDDESGALIGLAMWQSRAHYLAARPAMMAAVGDDPFDEWEDAPPDLFRMSPV